jgi:hypothetical protein
MSPLARRAVAVLLTLLALRTSAARSAPTDDEVVRPAQANASCPGDDGQWTVHAGGFDEVDDIVALSDRDM